MQNKFTSGAETALSHAQIAAAEMGHTYIGSEHILLGIAMAQKSIGAKILSELGASAEKIRTAIIDTSGEGEKTHLTSDDITPRARAVIASSSNFFKKGTPGSIGTEHLLSALLDEEGCVALRILENLNIPIDDLHRKALNYVNIGLEEDENVREITQIKHERRANLQTPLKNAPSINQYGRDLTALAERECLDPVISRESETGRVIQIISRRTKNNPCLIGEPGVGKTAVVEGLAQRIASGSVPEALLNKRIITLDIPSMIAGAKYRGEFEERLKNVMHEAKNQPDIILFVDEIHTIIGAGAAEGAIDAANIIKPALARGELQMIGATTLDEYKRHIEKDPALERRFQAVVVSEPSKSETVEMLRGLRTKYEEHHRVKISDEAIEAAVEMSVRYIHDKFLPDKAFDLIDEAASRVRIRAYSSPPEIKKLEERLKKAEEQKLSAIRSQDFEAAAKFKIQENEISDALNEKRKARASDRKGGEFTVNEKDIAQIINMWTSIPVARLTEDVDSRLEHLAEEIKQDVIGQDIAIDLIVKAIKRGRSGLSSPDRPIGSFVFLGESGIGKTHLSKVLCKCLFESENALIRFDMSEYMERHSIAKLIGSPPGYVGYDEGGLLTEQVRRKPYSVILFDEIEKAHPDVQNLFLQILDDGVLTDSKGRRVYFKNCVIIMTSNLGAASTGQKSISGFSDFSSSGNSADDERMLKAFKSQFRPEFINRIDEIIVFRKLNDNDLTAIANKAIQRIIKRAHDIKIDLEVAPSVINLALQAAKNENGGARSVERATARLIEESLTDRIFLKQIKRGDKITATVDNGKIIYTHR